MRFSTFSTGFSTMKRCKPYTHRNPSRKLLETFGQKCGHSAFYKKESRSIFFVFYKAPPQGRFGFSNLESNGRKFSTPGPARFYVWKRRGKLEFSTGFGCFAATGLCCGKKPQNALYILCFRTGCATI